VDTLLRSLSKTYTILTSLIKHVSAALLTVGWLGSENFFPICYNKLTVTPGSSYAQDWAVDVFQESSPYSVGFHTLNFMTFLAVIVVPAETKESFSPAEFGCAWLGVALSSVSCRFLCTQLCTTMSGTSGVLAPLGSPAFATHSRLRLEAPDLGEPGPKNRAVELV